MATEYDGTAPLGEGGYGSVFLGTYKGRVVAVKRVEVFRLLNDNEEQALKQLDHPNIVQLFYSDRDNNFKYFYLELCEASLDQVFLDPNDPKKYKGPSLPRYIDVCRQLAIGLEFIHSKQLIHRDIKPGNILISVRSTGKSGEVTIKWADFGLSKSVNDRGTCTMSDVRGTRNWYAPELLKLLLDNQETIKARGSVKSDVFALGLVFGYLFLGGKHPYGSNEFQITNNIMGGKMPEDVQGILIECCGDEILGLMLKVNPNERITSAEVVPKLKLMKNKLTEKGIQLILNWDRTLDHELIEKIKHLSRLGFDVNAKDGDGWNALHRLCKSNSTSNLIDAIQLLIQLGIDVNAKNIAGQNALHILCRYYSTSNLIDAIELLIKLGIDVNAKDPYGRNALHFLCAYNSTSNLIDAIQLLIQLGIDVNAKDNSGQNALYYLSDQNSTSYLNDAIQLLIQLGIDVNAKNIAGQNALHHLCQNYSTSNLIDAIQLLIQLGIDVNAKDPYGRNALHFLCGNNSTSNLIDAIKLLIPLGIDVNAKDPYGRNALHFLCAYNSTSNLIDAIKLLIKLGMPVVSDGQDARFLIRSNNKIKNKDEILKLLDKAARI